MNLSSVYMSKNLGGDYVKVAIESVSCDMTFHTPEAKSLLLALKFSNDFVNKLSGKTHLSGNSR